MDIMNEKGNNEKRSTNGSTSDKQKTKNNASPTSI